MRHVPFVDFKSLYGPLKADLIKATASVLDSCRYVGGPEVDGFEKEMAVWLGVPEVCGVSCATLGLFSTLKCMGVGPGDEVITTVHTAIATSEAVSLTGAKVVFVDIKRGSFNLDPAQVKAKITTRTKVIIPVHLYGQPAEMDEILGIARKHHLRVIEDCAQAQGARYKGKLVGTMGDAGVYSFFPSKNLGGFGDGGAVYAKDPALMRKIRMFSNHGRESKYDHLMEGINSRLDSLQAALLRVCLPHLDEWNERRRTAAAWYDKALAGVKGISCPKVLPDTQPVYHLYVVLVPDRNSLQEYLKDRGIETGIHYPYSLNLLPAYEHLKLGNGYFPEAEYACSHMLSLPMHPCITREDVEQTCDEMRRHIAESGK